MEQNFKMAVCTIDEFVEMSSKKYATIINKGMKLKRFMPTMLWGPPGIGKSQAVYEFAEKLAQQTNKKVFVNDIRLATYTPVDLVGIPYANQDRTKTTWLRPEMYDMDESDDVINILFLDELSSAQNSVQAAAYQIVLDRKIGNHTFPDNCIIIAAGNRVTDNAIAFKQSSALANRLAHVEIKTDASAWLQWARNNEIDYRVTSYIEHSPDKLYGEFMGSDIKAFATPRTWEAVSNILSISDSFNENELYNEIVALIGVYALDFLAWVKRSEELPKVDDIFNGKAPAAPKTSDAIYALINEMITYANKHSDLQLIDNSIKYVTSHISPDNAFVYIESIQKIAKISKKLTLLSSYNKWISKFGYLL